MVLVQCYSSVLAYWFERGWRSCSVTQVYWRIGLSQYGLQSGSRNGDFPKHERQVLLVLVVQHLLLSACTRSLSRRNGENNWLVLRIVTPKLKSYTFGEERAAGKDAAALCKCRLQPPKTRTPPLYCQSAAKPAPHLGFCTTRLRATGQRQPRTPRTNT